MKAYITSIGEPTTGLCFLQLAHMGFDPVVLDGPTSLWAKLQVIYNDANEDFIRIDADVIPNRNVANFWQNTHEAVWWVQSSIFDWYKQDIGTGGIHFIRKEALPALRQGIKPFSDAQRPESQMFRLSAFHEPRRCITSTVVAGLHGYGQNDVERVRQVKRERKQENYYDWDLVEALAHL